MIETVDEGRYGILPCNLHTSLSKGNSWEQIACPSQNTSFMHEIRNGGRLIYENYCLLRRGFLQLGSHQTTRRHIPEDNIIIFARHPTYTRKVTLRWHATGIVHDRMSLWSTYGVLSLTRSVKYKYLQCLSEISGLDSNFWHLEPKCEF
jgi:hypothetical protein